jgi:hypothetical protein
LVTGDKLPASLVRVDGQLARFLADSGYLLLPESILNREVPGRFSEIDDETPATLFQILFSEFY